MELGREKKAYSPSEVAKLANMSVQDVYNAIYRKKLVVVKEGHYDRITILRKDVKQWLKQKLLKEKD